MLVLGIKVSAKELHFSIYDIDHKKIVFYYNLLIPQKNLMDEPQSYRFLRHHIIDTIDNTLINNKKISWAAIRSIEYTARNKNIKRIEMEGIIKESFASSILLGYTIENKQSISFKTGFDKNMITNILDKSPTKANSDLIKKQILNWEDFNNKEYRESSLISLALALGVKKNG